MTAFGLDDVDSHSGSVIASVLPPIGRPVVETLPARVQIGVAYLYSSLVAVGFLKVVASVAMRAMTLLEREMCSSSLRPGLQFSRDAVVLLLLTTRAVVQRIEQVVGFPAMLGSSSRGWPYALTSPVWDRTLCL